MKGIILNSAFILVLLPQVSFAAPSTTGAGQLPTPSFAAPSVPATPAQQEYAQAQLTCFQQEGQDRAAWIKNNTTVMMNQDTLTKSFIASRNAEVQQAKLQGKPVPPGGPIPEDPALAAFEATQYSKKQACLEAARQQFIAAGGTPTS